MPRTHQSAGVTGFTPAQIRQAYGVNNILFNGGIKGDGKGMTIAIVDPGNAPTIKSDLHAFDLQFGLPDPPSFKVVNQHGSTSPASMPIDDPFTAVEIALDVEWAHAIAPAANILLVEVLDPFSPNSGGALDPTQMYLGNLYAKSQPGVVVVSNSWGGGEVLGESASDSVFTTPTGHPGETFVFSAGDSGGPASYPSTSPNVLSVGGTALKLSSTNNWASETVWNGKITNTGAGGGGQSAYLVQQPAGRVLSLGALEGTPNYQKNLGLSGRGTPDVTFNGDPLTGFAVYDSFSFGAATPWDTIGGTSAGAPIWSALIAIADQGRSLVGKSSLANAQAVMYTLPHGDFHDIIVGNNDYLGFGLGLTGNSAGIGYDLASGLGSPISNLVIRDLVSFNGS
jgi:subtilase family serine protease